jgi:hypothetical protein
MAISFPPAPVTAQVYVYLGVTFTYTGVFWSRMSASAQAPITVSTTAPSNPTTGQLWLDIS